MQESIWGYWIIILGVSILSIMVLVNSYSTTNEQDYFLTKSILESSMKEAVDFGYSTDTGELKMNREKFVENFLRRFAETVNINKGYQINFYDIYEIPPAASVSITAKTNETNFGQQNTGNSEQGVSVNRLTGILYTTQEYQKTLPGGGDPTSGIPGSC